MRILLVEEEIQIAQYLRKGLLENGFAVDVARPNAETFRTRVEYDLLVCDLAAGRPRFPELRREPHQAPVLFLADRAPFPYSGQRPQDYLLKPFSFSDFLDRVR